MALSSNSRLYARPNADALFALRQLLVADDAIEPGSADDEGARDGWRAAMTIRVTVCYTQQRLQQPASVKNGRRKTDWLFFTGSSLDMQ